MKKARNKSECERYVEKIKPNIERTKKAGIFTKANMILGFEGENQETIRESVKLIKESAPDLSIHFGFPAPNPGSVMGKMAEQRGIISPDGEGLQYDELEIAMALGFAWNKYEPCKLVELQKFANNAVKMSNAKKLELGLKLVSHIVRKREWDIFLNVGKIALQKDIHILDLAEMY